MRTEQSQALFDAARARIPGGVNSPVRAFGRVGGRPLFVTRAEGVTIWDADDNAYMDFVGSWGPMFLGHNHAAIREAVADQLQRGTSYGAPTAAEVELAERVCEMVPSMDMVRLTSSGTEATMSALRLARAFTGRDGFVKFRGGYHGHGDAFLVEAGSGAAGTPAVARSVAGAVPGRCKSGGSQTAAAARPAQRAAVSATGRIMPRPGEIRVGQRHRRRRGGAAGASSSGCRCAGSSRAAARLRASAASRSARSAGGCARILRLSKPPRAAGIGTPA